MALPTFIINLDLPPEQRWKQLVTNYKQECLEIFNYLETLSQQMLGGVAKTIINGFIEGYRYFYDVMYQKELEGIANTLGVSINKLILGQLVYESCACCTSVIFKFKGNNLHFRTMDWDMDILKKVTVNLVFKKNNQVLFGATSWVGYVGIMTGMMSGQYTVALNYRRSKGNLFDNFMRTLAQKWPIGYLIRYVLENNYSLGQALDMFKYSLLIAPCYITVSDSQNRCHNIIREHDSLVNYIVSDDWICQTNNDPGCSDPTKNILWSMERRNKVNELIFKESQNWQSYEDIIKSFLVYPILNKETVYCVLMDVKAGGYEAMVI